MADATKRSASARLEAGRRGTGDRAIAFAEKHEPEYDRDSENARRGCWGPTYAVTAPPVCGPKKASSERGLLPEAPTDTP